jgi:Uma2 family endonuclease
MKAPALHHFSVEDYYRMAEAGILAPDARVELIEGAIHDMSPIGPLHGGIVNRLIQIFTLRPKGRWIISAQNPVGLDRYSEPEPDLVLLKPAPDDYVSHHPVPEDVLLLIEVADTSLDFDRLKKIPIYARAGIPEVWIVNLRDSVIEVYREPHFSDYGQKTVACSGDKISPAAFSDTIVDVAALLKR